VLADSSCDNIYFSWANGIGADNNCLCVQKGADCSNSNNLEDHDVVSTWRINSANVNPTPKPTEPEVADQSGETSFKYMGCVEDRQNNRAMSDGRYPLFLKDCVVYCRGKGSQYCGYQNGNECYCTVASDDYHKHGWIDDQNCSTIMDDEGNRLGGSYMIAVYAINPGNVDRFLPISDPPTPTGYGNTLPPIQGVSDRGVPLTYNCNVKCTKCEIRDSQYCVECMNGFKLWRNHCVHEDAKIIVNFDETDNFDEAYVKGGADTYLKWYAESRIVLGHSFDQSEKGRGASLSFNRGDSALRFKALDKVYGDFDATIWYKPANVSHDGTDHRLLTISNGNKYKMAAAISSHSAKDGTTPQITMIFPRDSNGSPNSLTDPSKSIRLDCRTETDIRENEWNNLRLALKNNELICCINSNCIRREFSYQGPGSAELETQGFDLSSFDLKFDTFRIGGGNSIVGAVDNVEIKLITEAGAIVADSETGSGVIIILVVIATTAVLLICILTFLGVRKGWFERSSTKILGFKDQTELTRESSYQRAGRPTPVPPRASPMRPPRASPIKPPRASPIKPPRPSPIKNRPAPPPPRASASRNGLPVRNSHLEARISSSRGRYSFEARNSYSRNRTSFETIPAPPKLKARNSSSRNRYSYEARNSSSKNRTSFETIPAPPKRSPNPDSN